MGKHKQTAPKDGISNENFQRDYPTQKHGLSKGTSAVIVTKDPEFWLGGVGGSSSGFPSINKSAEMPQDFMEIFSTGFIPMHRVFLYSPEIQQLCVIFILGL